MTHKKKDNTDDSWDAAAEGWVDFVRTDKDYWRDGVNNPAAFKLIGNVKRKTLLDLACGEGYNTRILAPKGAKVTGIDHSEKLLNLAKKEEQRKPLGICYYRRNADRLSGLPDAFFDVVTCFMALHDIENFEGAISEVARVLKCGGRFVFSIVHPCFEDMVINGVRINAAEKYFDHVQYSVEWNMERLTKPFRTVSFHRSLTDYSFALAKNGLLILRLVEPQPTEEGMRKHPSLRKVLTKPQSIVFETIKP